MVRWAQTAIPVVSLMSGSPTFDTENLQLRQALRARGINTIKQTGFLQSICIMLFSQGGDWAKERDKELLKRLYNICYS